MPPADQWFAALSFDSSGTTASATAGNSAPSCKDISYGSVFGKGKNGSSALQNTGLPGMN